MAAWAAPASYLKGVTYFGDSSPTTYWNSNIQRAADDFKEIRADGFNTVILVVPWGEFQPGVNPVRFNDDAFKRLSQVCNAAKQEGLNVFVRVSYLWDFYPDVQMPNFQRANALLSNDSLMLAWKQYLKRIGVATQGCGTGHFIAWEDFWFMLEVATFDAKAKRVAEHARQVSFDAWVRANAGPEFLNRNEVTAQRLGHYPFPPRNSPDYALVLRWFDDQFVQRLMPTVASILPGASMEVRADDDPIYRGDKLQSWFSHKKTYKVKSSPYVMTYWAPAIGAKNLSDFESASKVTERFSYMQKKISASTGNKIFIEQFLFKDNTPEAAHNTKIAPEQLSEFLKGIASPLLRLTSGYALWGARDYDASLLFNGFFSLGELGWQFTDGAVVKKAGNFNVAQLIPGAAVQQTVPLLRGNAPGLAKSTTLRLQATGPGTLEVSFAGGVKSVTIGTRTQEVSVALPLAFTDANLKISALAGNIAVSDVYLYFHSHVSDVRSAQGQPRQHLEDIRKLNQSLAQGADVPTRLAADDNSLAQASGVFGREQDTGVWFAWASDQVAATLFTASDTLRVDGYIKPSLFKNAKSCTLTAFGGGKKLMAQQYTADGPVALSVPLPGSVVGAPLDFRLTSSCVLKPQRGKPGGDSRALSFVLREISARPALAPSPAPVRPASVSR